MCSKLSVTEGYSGRWSLRWAPMRGCARDGVPGAVPPRAGAPFPRGRGLYIQLYILHGHGFSDFVT